MDPLTILTALGPLAGAMGGGGGTEVSQSASNTTNVSLSTILSNQSPGTQSAPTTGNASGAASSGAGQEPLALSPFATPYEGFGSLAAEDNFNAAIGSGQPSKQLLVAGAVLAAGVAVLVFMGKTKRR